jgi:putative heme-binding domain-containing protein
MKYYFSGIKNFCFLFLLALATPTCRNSTETTSESFHDIAANPEVAEYLAQFEGRGDQTDDSQPLPPEESLAHFQHPEDLSIELVAAEPLINQPVYINFDHRGRLWVVQYKQYPYPQGLKMTGVDYHLRAQFDTVPAPPPMGEKGADKITLLEDTNGDGRYDQATDAIAGLNIVTAVTWGRGRIWVLNPPYLLAYPDPDGDGFPNGDPKVHLRGFGLEDTHAVANSLRWGPDGWLYGAQGSTTTATIYSSATKGVHFKGQGIWRYHPETEVFELFAEGGGNTFYVEMDDKGRIYSGHNGGESRGQYYKQGGYYLKNWGKHGALTNPYAFGFFPHMGLEGDRIRFTHGFIRYGGDGLPDSYRDALIAINPLHNFVQSGRFQAEGSNFRTLDETRILTTDDHWFRPVDLKAGPDGGVYLADWYDSRLSHVDPRDTWHKSSGRIYRLTGKDKEPSAPTDFSQLNTDELIEVLSHPNRWHRQQAQRQFGDRKNKAVIPKLRSLLDTAKGQLALEALWAIHLSGGLDAGVAALGLGHADPFVRMWTIRLLGDQREISPVLLPGLLSIAQSEKHPEVRSQLACSAKRLSPGQALPLIRAMLLYDADQQDPHNPLLIWWALENQAEADREAVLDLFREKNLWNRPLVQETILERLMQRYVMAGGAQNLAAATQLLALAPSAELARPLLAGLEEGLRGREMTELSAGLLALVDRYRAQLGESSLDLALRNQQPEAVEQALALIADPAADRTEQLHYIRLFGEIDQPKAIPVLLEAAASNRSSGGMRQAALQALKRYDEPEIGAKVADWYPDRLRADEDVRLAALELFVSRPVWAVHLVESIEKSRRIDPADVPVQLARQLPLLGNPEITTAAGRIWPELNDVSAREKQERIKELSALTRARPGNAAAGKPIFQGLCGACHRLFGEGGQIGPDLTGYDRRNLNDLLLNTVDPNAEIREGYVNFLIETKDGRTLSGLVTDQSGGRVRLRSFNGEETTLAEDQIVRMQALQQSLMPERLLEALSPTQIQDLFAYLMMSNEHH